MFSVSHYDNVVFITSDSTYTMSSFMVSLQKEDKHYVKTNNLISALMLQKSLRQRSEAAKRVMIVFLMLDRIKFYINIKYFRGIFFNKQCNAFEYERKLCNIYSYAWD